MMQFHTLSYPDNNQGKGWFPGFAFSLANQNPPSYGEPPASLIYWRLRIPNKQFKTQYTVPTNTHRCFYHSEGRNIGESFTIANIRIHGSFTL